MLKVEAEIAKFLKPLLESEGVDLGEVKLINDGDENLILEIGIHLVNGETDLNAIEKISPFISDWLDLLDPIEESYFLDVYAFSSK